MLIRFFLFDANLYYPNRRNVVIIELYAINTSKSMLFLLKMTCFEPDLKGEVTYLKDFEIGKSIIGISAISGNAMALIARDRANTDYIYFLECQTPPHDWYVSITWKTDEKLLSVHLSDDGLLLYTLSESRLSSYVPDPFGGILQRRWTMDLAHGEKHCTAIPNTGAMIALGSSNGMVTVYLSGGTRAWSTDLSSTITTLAFSNSGDLLAVGCSTGDLHIYTGHGDPVLTRKFDKSIYSLAFSPSCTNTVVGFEDGTTQIFRPDLGAPLKTSTFVCPARHVSFSRSGETILICLDRKLVLIDHCNVVWAGLPTRDRESALTLLGAALSADSSYCIAAIKRGNTADCLRFYSIKLPQMLIREAEAETCIKEGTALFQRKKYVEAFDCFVRAEKLSEPSLFTAFCKGESLFHLDELKRANEFYRECLGFNNTNARSIDACIMRGITALRLNNEDLAYAAFSDAERLSPNDSTARYLLTLVQYRKSKGEMSCPAPIDDYNVGGIPVSLASFIPSMVPNRYKKCFIMPCYSDEADEILEKKMFTTQVSKSIDAGYSVGKGDAGLIYNVDSDSLVGVFEAHSFPRIGPLMPSFTSARVGKSRKNVLSIAVVPVGSLQSIPNARSIITSLGREVLVSRTSGAFMAKPVFEGEDAAHILYHFGLAPKPVPYPQVGTIVKITGESFKGAEAIVTSIDRERGKITVELCDVVVAVPIELDRDMVELPDADEPTHRS